LLGCIFATKTRIDNRKKNLLNSNIFSRCPHNMANFGPLTAEICWRVWGTPANFNGFSVLASLLQRRRSPEANQTLHDVWPSPGLVRYIYIFGGSCPNGILPSAKFTLRPSLAFSYIDSVTAWHSSSGRQPNFAALYKEWNYRTFAEGATYIRQGGDHVGHQPTFLVFSFIFLGIFFWGGEAPSPDPYPDISHRVMRNYLLQCTSSSAIV